MGFAIESQSHQTVMLIKNLVFLFILDELYVIDSKFKCLIIIHKI
jgi:hypothetical protein